MESITSAIAGTSSSNIDFANMDIHARVLARLITFSYLSWDLYTLLASMEGLTQRECWAWKTILSQLGLLIELPVVYWDKHHQVIAMSPTWTSYTNLTRKLYKIYYNAGGLSNAQSYNPLPTPAFDEKYPSSNTSPWLSNPKHLLLRQGRDHDQILLRNSKNLSQQL